MHRAFNSYDQKARMGPSMPPAWMPPSTAREMMQQQQQQSQQSFGYQQQPYAVAQSMPMPTPMALPMPMMMPVQYGFQPPTPGPSHTKQRSPRHRRSDSDSDSYHRHLPRRRHDKHSSGKSARRDRRQRNTHRKRSSSSSEDCSSCASERRRKGKHAARHSRRARSSSTDSSTSYTSSSSSSTGSSRRYSSSSGSISAREEVSSTASGQSSERGTTLTTNEMVMASQKAASTLAVPRGRPRRPAASISIPEPDEPTPSGSDLFMQIQRAYLHYPQPDPVLKKTPSLSPDVPSTRTSSTARASRPSSTYHTTSLAGEPDTFAKRVLPRPTLLRLPDSDARRALHPIGAGPESAFTRIGYQPVKSPRVPPQAYAKSASPSLPKSTNRSSFEHPDPLVISKSHPNSAQVSPTVTLFPPLEYEMPSRASSFRKSQRSHSRANSTFSSRYAAPAPSQIQAALQHRSVSEAAFPLAEGEVTVPKRAALSTAGSRLVGHEYFSKREPA